MNDSYMTWDPWLLLLALLLVCPFTIFYGPGESY